MQVNKFRVPILVGALLVATSCGQQPETNAATPGPSAPGPTISGQPVAEAEQIAAFCRAKFPDEFAGVSLSRDDDTILVYRTTGAQLDPAVSAQFATEQLRFVDSPRTELELKKLTDRVLGDIPYWQSEGIRVQGAGPDFVLGVVVVITPDDNPMTAEKLRTYYDGLVTVRGGEVAHPTMSVPSRISPSR